MKHPVYRDRLERFRDKIHRVYDQSQEEILNSVKPERKYDFEVDSEKMARMLIPNMGNYSNLREVLND